MVASVSCRNLYYEYQLKPLQREFTHEERHGRNFSHTPSIVTSITPSLTSHGMHSLRMGSSQFHTLRRQNLVSHLLKTFPMTLQRECMSLVVFMSCIVWYVASSLDIDISHPWAGRWFNTKADLSPKGDSGINGGKVSGRQSNSYQPLLRCTTPSYPMPSGWYSALRAVSIQADGRWPILAVPRLGCSNRLGTETYCLLAYWPLCGS